MKVKNREHPKITICTNQSGKTLDRALRNQGITGASVYDKRGLLFL